MLHIVCTSVKPGSRVAVTGVGNYLIIYYFLAEFFYAVGLV